MHAQVKIDVMKIGPHMKIGVKIGVSSFFPFP